MVPVIPWYITLTVVVTQVAIAVAVWRILARGAGRPVRLGLGVVLAVWLGVVFALAPAPASLAAHDAYYLDPLIPVFAGGSILLGLAAYAVFPALRRAAHAAPLPALVGVQVYRVVGVVFLIALALGQVPARFALPAGWGDITVGLTAPLVGFALARRALGARAVALGWNVFGLLDLIVAVGMGTGLLAPLLDPSLGTRAPAAAAMGAYPLFLVPAFAVPLSVLLHLLALARLRRPREASRAVATTV